MAEILGIASGAAGLTSLSMQLVGTVMKLRDLYRLYKDAPKMLETLAYEIETLNIFLNELGCDKGLKHCDAIDSLTLKRAVFTCQQRVLLVQETSAKIEAILLKAPKWGKIRTALEESEFRRLTMDLESAKTGIMLVYQSFTECMRRRDADIMQDQLRASQNAVRQLTELLMHDRSIMPANAMVLRSSIDGAPAGSSRPTPGTIANDVTSFQPKNAVPQKYSKSRTHPFGRRPPRTISFFNWFTQETWHISMRRSQAGWDFNIRTHNLVPPDSHIFWLCRYGDVPAVRSLIEEGRASAFDYTMRRKTESWKGSTPLSAAFMADNLGVARYLLSVAKHSEDDGSESLLNDHFPLVLFQKSDAWFRLLFQESDRVIDVNDFVVRGTHLRPKSNLYLKLLRSARTISQLNSVFASLPVSWKSLPQGLRLQRAMGLDVFSSPKEFLHAAGVHTFDSSVANFVDDFGTSVLHYAARQAAFQGRGPSPNILHKLWPAAIKQLLEAGADPLKTDRWGQSPLTAFLGIMQVDDADEYLRTFQSWLAILEQSGIDLMQYGEAQNRQWKQSKQWPVFYGAEFVHEIQCLVPAQRAEHWDIRVSRVFHIYIYKSVAPPGSWPRNEMVPQTFPWGPRAHDSSLGQALWQETKVIHSRVRSLSEMASSSSRDETRSLLVPLGAKDDSGVREHLNRRPKFFPSSLPLRRYSYSSIQQASTTHIANYEAREVAVVSRGFWKRFSW